MSEFSERENEMFNMLSEYERECRKNRYFPTCDLLDYIEKNANSFETVIPKDTIFYRARVYRNDIFEKWFNIGMEMKKATSSDDYNMYSNTILEMIEKEKRKIEEGFKGYDEKGSFVNPNTDTIE